jgi:hypothetical protein
LSINPPNDTIPIRLLASIGGITAAVAGFLYLAGMATMSVRFYNEGLTTQDLLPLFSLDQLLRVGLTWISPAVPALLGVVVLFLASVLFERQLADRARTFRDERASTLAEGDERDEFVAQVDRYLERTAWSDVLRLLPAAIAAAQASPAETDHAKAWRELRRRIWLFQGWTGLICFALLFACLWLAVPLAIAAFVCLTAAFGIVGTRPAQHALAPLFALVAVAFLANAILNPRPLPQAMLVTKQAETGVSGDYIVRSDSAWHLGDGKGGVFIVRDDDVVCSRLQSRPRSQSLLRLLFASKQRGPATQKLMCDAV